MGRPFLQTAFLPLISAVVSLSAGCDLPASKLSWDVSFACGVAADGVEKVRAELIEGGCGDGKVLFTEVTARDGSPVRSSTPTLARGTYGLEVQGLDAADTVLVRRCETLDLPSSSRTRVVLGLDVCEAGVDGSATPDAGTSRDGAQPGGDTDAGSDASDVNDAGDAGVDSGPMGPPDRDGDGVADDVDNAPDDKFRCSDIDSDKCDDCQALGRQDEAKDGPDLDSDGFCDCVMFADASAPDDSRDGTWWTRSFKTLQKAIDAAQMAASKLPSQTCEVWVARGTYPVYATQPTDSLKLQKSVPLYGGFAGTEVSRAQRALSANETILSGANNSYHVVQGADQAVLDGFTISDGNANGAGDDSKGGGVFAKSVSPVLRNLKFENNKASFGGALYIESASPEVTSCEFITNSATMSGGAIYVLAGTDLRIESSYFAENSSPAGGALSFEGASTAKVVNSAFWFNTTTQSGGATIDQGTGNTQYWNCTFVDNTAILSGPDAAVGGSATQRFYSSILQGPDGAARWARINGGTIEMTSCISSYTQVNDSGYTTTSPIAGTATFVNRKAGNLHLVQDSVGIDQSYSNAETPTVDLEGKPAVGVRDVGAYEYGN